MAHNDIFGGSVDVQSIFIQARLHHQRIGKRLYVVVLQQNVARGIDDNAIAIGAFRLSMRVRRTMIFSLYTKWRFHMGPSTKRTPSTRMLRDFQNITKLGRIPSMPEPLPKIRCAKGTRAANTRGGAPYCSNQSHQGFPCPLSVPSPVMATLTAWET